MVQQPEGIETKVDTQYYRGGQLDELREPYVRQEPNIISLFDGFLYLFIQLQGKGKVTPKQAYVALRGPGV
jgi:hypothetical protein